ncbi:MAG TPA: hypothetical protein VFH15_13210 [Pyrinomonadaceae bacterium]|nr:hypothetical protein [Pyrinomonadaceae bacterium]
MTLRRFFAIGSAAILFVTGVIVYALYSRPTYQGIRAGRADENYLKSGDCRSCHEGHYQSWARTFHSRMTQEAKPATVQGDFDHDSFDYLGVNARMERRGDGFAMSFTFPDRQKQTLSVDRTVGSRRIDFPSAF